MLPDIKSLSREELEAQFKTWGEPAYRVTQLLEWLYARRAITWPDPDAGPVRYRHYLPGPA